MSDRDALVGRADALDQLRRALPSGSAFVRGEPGMGKTALLRAVASEADGHLGWGTAVASGAPGFWVWTQALTGLVRAVGTEAAGVVAGADRALLSTLVPSLGDARSSEPSERERLLLVDATVSWLHRLAAAAPVVLVLDDLQWADASSLTLLEHVVSRPREGQLALLGAYRPEEATPLLDRAATLGEHVVLGGLDLPSVAALVGRVLGPSAGPDVVDRIYARAGGHPLFTRELALAEREGALPAAVRQAVAHRVGALSPAAQDVLSSAALLGNALLVDVLAEVHDDRALVEQSLDEAAQAGLVQSADGWQFAHDVYREAVVDDISSAEQARRHAALARALDARAARGGEVAAADLARHHREGLPHADLARAAQWALRATGEDLRGLALEEAAAHIRGLRAAVADTGLALPDEVLTDLLLAEADVLARTGRLPDARGLLRAAADAARRAQDGSRVAYVALAAAALGSRFASRRDELVAELENALSLVQQDPVLQARLTAVLARELQHSVPEERARGVALTERALELARGTDEPSVMRACLLARHDVLWTPGAAGERVSVTEELVDLARRGSDQAALGEALLLQANALLEAGNPRFAPVLAESLALLEALDLPGPRYTVLTRRACLALMHGDLEPAESLIEEAAALGEQLREPDAANVRMSQRLELVRLRNEPGQLQEFAAQAVAHWTGAPVHAHSVAAGFSARAGDLDAARHHLAVVDALGSWQTDRSYLWSVYVRELATAAIAVEDRQLCASLLEVLLPLAGTCGVNGAAVAFAGCHAHTAGLLAGALGDGESSSALLRQAAEVHARLGVQSGDAQARAALRRNGPTWDLVYGGRSATVPHSKGVLDLAVLLAHPREDVHVLDLVQAGAVEHDSGPALDRAAASSYRGRLEALAQERADAEAAGDDTRLALVAKEHEALVEELGRSTAVAGRARALGASTSERARKAVAARLRDAVRRIEEVLPELAEHLDRSLVTGVRCRYTGEEVWEVRTN